MGNGLSQNEIDALLAGVDESSMSPMENTNMGGDPSFKDLDNESSRKDMQDLNEFLNSALSSAFNVLSRALETEIAFSSLKSSLKDSDKIANSLQGKQIVVSQVLKGSLNGEVSFIFNEKGALKLVEKMLDQEQTVLSEIALDTFGENFNQFFSSIHSWIKNSYKQEVSGDIPKVQIIENPLDIEFAAKQSMQVDFNIRLGDDSSDIAVVMALPVTVSKEILNISIMGSRVEGSFDDIGGYSEKSSKNKQINARPVQFSRLDQGSNRSPLGNIEILLDVSMQVTVELGRTKMRIREILGLGEGSIIELQKLAGEPVDILVNANPIAKGEVVVIDEYFGVRITEIMSPKEMMDVMNTKDEN